MAFISTAKGRSLLTAFNEYAHAHARLMNVDYWIAEKWSGQNRTSRTGPAASEAYSKMCSLQKDKVLDRKISYAEII